MYNVFVFLVIKTGVVSQAKGSAYIEVGKTKVIVSVFDPREIPNKNEYSLKGELYCEFKYAPFSCAIRRGHMQDAEEKQNSIVLKQALEPAVCLQEFPNFQVDIYVLVLQNDGAALSSAITCAGVALVHAGVPMFDVVTSVSLGMQKDKMLIDPTYEEERLCDLAVVKDKTEKTYHSHGNICFAMLSTHQQITQMYQIGNFNLDNVTECINLLTNASKDLVPLVEKCIVKHTLKTIDESTESQA